MFRQPTALRPGVQNQKAGRLLKTPTIFFPALIGLLPMPGGAIFSAPMVKSMGEEMEMKVNEWKRWWKQTFPDCEASRHKVQNVHCGGPIRYTTSLLLLLPGEVSQLLGLFDDVDNTRVEFDDKDHGNDPLTEILVRKLS